MSAWEVVLLVMVGGPGLAVIAILGCVVLAPIVARWLP